MRPGLVFVGLFILLMALYFLLRDSLSVLGTFLLQASLVIVILAGAVWYRFAKHRSGWFFFRTETDEDEEKHDDSGKGSGGGAGAGESDGGASESIRKAS